MTEFFPGQPLPSVEEARERTVDHARLKGGTAVTMTSEGNTRRWRLSQGPKGLEYGEGGRAQLQAWLKG